MNKTSHSRRKQRRAAQSPPRRPGNHLKVEFSEQQIRQRVRQLARQITRDYEGKSLHIVGVLDNCLVFLSDLLRALEVPAGCSLISTRTRDSDAGSVSIREISYVPPVDLAGKDILLLDGVLQSGVTLDYLHRMLLAQHPASLRTAALIDKSDERKVDVPLDYTGFKVSKGFLVGYGLAFQEQYRGLPYLARFG